MIVNLKEIAAFVYMRTYDSQWVAFGYGFVTAIAIDCDVMFRPWRTGVNDNAGA